MKSKYVKITKATKPSFWYANRIGKVYEVIERYKDDYHVLKDNVQTDFLIKKDDCLVLNTVNRPAEVDDLVMCVKDPGPPPRFEPGKVGKFFRVTKVSDPYCYVNDTFKDGSQLWFKKDEYVVLEEPKRSYVEAEREAEIGDKIKIVSPGATYGAYGINDVMTVKDKNEYGVCCDEAVCFENAKGIVLNNEYVVLEPIEEELGEVEEYEDVDVLTDLKRRVEELERRLARCKNV